MGPLLFLVYIADLAEALGPSCRVVFFADDVKIFKVLTSPMDSDDLQSSLDRLSDWSAANRLPMAPPKCRVLHLGKNNPRRKYVLDIVELQVTDCVNDLGFRLCPSLNP